MLATTQIVGMKCPGLHSVYSNLALEFVDDEDSVESLKAEIVEMEKIVVTLEFGEVGGPVRTSAGYHILKLVSRSTSEPPSFQEVRNTLERNLMAQKEESARSQWIAELKETTYVEIFPDDR